MEGERRQLSQSKKRYNKLKARLNRKRRKKRKKGNSDSGEEEIRRKARKEDSDLSGVEEMGVIEGKTKFHQPLSSDTLMNALENEDDDIDFTVGDSYTRDELANPLTHLSAKIIKEVGRARQDVQRFWEKGGIPDGNSEEIEVSYRRYLSEKNADLEMNEFINLTTLFGNTQVAKRGDRLHFMMKTEHSNSGGKAHANESPNITDHKESMKKETDQTGQRKLENDNGTGDTYVPGPSGLITKRNLESDDLSAGKTEGDIHSLNKPIPTERGKMSSSNINGNVLRTSTLCQPSTSKDTYLTGLKLFWEENYEEAEPGTDTRLLPADIFEFYRYSKWYRHESYEQFVRLSSIVTGSTYSSRLSRILYYNVRPISTDARNFLDQTSVRDSMGTTIRKKGKGEVSITCGENKGTFVPEKCKIQKRRNNRENKILLQNLTKFWDANYNWKLQSSPKRLEPKEVFLFYKQCVADETNFDKFKTNCGRMGVRLVGADGFKKFQVSPLSPIAKAWHAREEQHISNRESTNQVPAQCSSEQIPVDAVDNAAAQCTVHLLNTQGLVTNKRNKSEMLRLKCDKGGSNIIALTETWLYENKHFDEEILNKFPEYSIQRTDRNIAKRTSKKKRGDENKEEDDGLESCGGCLLLASPGLTLLPITSSSNGVCELLICEVPQLNMATAVIYNPPKPNFSFPKFKEVLSKVEKYLTANEEKGDKQLDFTLMGDFNFPPNIVTWEKSKHGMYPVVKPGETDGQKEACRLLVDLMNRFSLTQIVDKPTRKNNVLDLILTDNPDIFTPTRTLNMNTLSDHRLVSTQVTTRTNIQHSCPSSNMPEAATFNLFRADKDKLAKVLSSVDWEKELREDNTNTIDVKTRFDGLVVRCMKEAGVPKFKNQRVKDMASDEVMKVEKKAERIELKRQHQNAREVDKTQAAEEVKKIHKKMQSILDEAADMKETKLLNGIKSNPRAFYKHANQTRKGKTKIGPLLSKGKYYSDPIKMANLLSQQYESVFSEPREDISQHQNIKLTTATLNDIEIKTDDIIKAISEMVNGSAAGPDGIPVVFYKDYAEVISKPLLMIWRNSLDSGVQPDEPILAIITPLHKGGPKCFAKNYRPVALTNHMTKIFERVLRKRINEYLDENGLMNPTQHGFRSGRSTMTQLLNYYENIMDIVVEGCAVDSIYLDFSKAFDKVDHNILLAKLQNLGIGGKIHSWITSFLKNRQQVVRVEGFLSEKVWVKSGVPQGSVLGPLLFLIMMLDITNGIKYGTLSSFADDTRLWMRIRNLLDTNKLQEDLDALYQWSEANNMDFNSDKFEGQSYGKDEEQYYRAPDLSSIAQNNVLKDLGVYMAEDLKFENHIHNVVAKGRRMSGWVKRTIRSRRADHMKVLLKSLVRSQVEYCCMLWSPREQRLINLIESVQRDFTRQISKYQQYDDVLKMPLCAVSYSDRLKDLKIYSLERRRERMQILYLYKMTLHVVPNAGFEWSYCPRRKLTITPKISSKQGWAHTLRNSSFSVIGPKLFNSIPKELRELPDLAKTPKQLISQFKVNLDKYLSTIPDMPGQANSLLDHEGIDYGFKMPTQAENSSNSSASGNNNPTNNHRTSNKGLVNSRREQSRWDAGPNDLI